MEVLSPYQEAAQAGARGSTDPYFTSAADDFRARGAFGYQPGSIIDIGGSQLSATLKTSLEEKLFGLRSHQLTKADGQPQRLLPSPLLSDDRGLSIWRDVNRLPDYYQTQDEVELLEKYGVEIADCVPDGASLLDLGSGDTRKIRPLLDQLNARRKGIRYFALDLSRESLETSLQEFVPRYRSIECYGLWGLFQEGLEWLHNLPSPRWICSLGSSLGNDWYEAAVAHLQRWNGKMEEADRLLVGMDSCKDYECLWRSYHDSHGLFTTFMQNGMKHANRVMGEDWYRPEDWQIRGIFHNEPCMHQFAFVAQRDVFCESTNVAVKKGTQIDCYEAFKWSPEEMRSQFEASNFQQLAMWRSPSTRICEYLLKIKSGTR